jgi:ribonuclease HI
VAVRRLRKLTRTIGRTVAGTFSTAKGEDAIREAVAPPTCPTLDRRRERLLASALVAPTDAPKRALLPPRAEDDSSRRRIYPWYRGASGHGRRVKEGQQLERVKRQPRDRTPWASPESPREAVHAWSDGSIRKSAGMGWVVTRDSTGEGEAVAQDHRSLGPIQTAYDAEVSAIEGAIFWFLHNRNGGSSLVVRSDSTSAFARMGHRGGGPGQEHAVRVQGRVTALSGATRKRTVDLVWVKGHAGTPGNERADQLTGRAAEMIGTHATMSLAYIRLRISKTFREAKDAWHANPTHHGTEEILPPPPKKSMLKRARNSIARVAAQIRTGHWCSAVYLKRTHKRDSNRCWLCEGRDGVQHRMLRAHVLLNCRNPRLVSARTKAWKGKSPGSARRLLADPRWEKWFVHFLELSGFGRTLADGVDEESAYASRMDMWIAWETEEVVEVERLTSRSKG